MGWSSSKENVTKPGKINKEEGKEVNSVRFYEEFLANSDFKAKQFDISLNSSKFNYLAELGSGSYSEVSLYSRGSNEDSLYAVKSMPKIIVKSLHGKSNKKNDLVIYNQNLKGSIFHELDLLSKFDHPGISKYFSCFENEKNVEAVLEFCPGDTLNNVCKSLPPGLWDAKLTIVYLLSKTMHYLKNHDIIHRDLKPKNIIISKDPDLKFGYSVKLVDFGLAKESGRDSTYAGSPQFMAPESFRKESDFCSDVWSLGIIFYNMISDSYPFDGHTHRDLYEAVSMDFLDFSPRIIWGEVPEEVFDLIKKMLEKDTKKRISIEEVIEHDCFKDMKRYEAKLNLNDDEIGKIQNFLWLSPLSQALLSYSIRYLPHEKVSKADEKFILWDKSNLGYIPVIKESQKSSQMEISRKPRKLSEVTAAETLMSSKTIRGIQSHKLSYSEFIAAMSAKEDLISEEVAEFIFEDLSPNPIEDLILQPDFLKSPFFSSKPKEIKSDLFLLLGDKGISSDWLKSHILSLYK